MSDPNPPTPMAGSYAARSMQAHSAHGGQWGHGASQPQQPQQPQYQQQQQAPQPAWSQQQQQQHPQQQPNAAAAAATNTGAAAASAYAAQQQQYPQQPPPQPQQYASAATNAGTTLAPTPAATAANATYRRPDSHHHHGRDALTPAQIAEQQRLLSDSTRRVQEHAYYMKEAMACDDVSVALDRASSMLSELGDPNHHHPHHHHNPSMDGGHAHHKPTLNPKNYYELHMRCLDELPNLEAYLSDLCTDPHAADDQEDPLAGIPGMLANTVYGGNVGGPGSTSNNGNVRYTAEQLYAAVQFAPRAVPRLYLQILMGSVLIKSGERTAKSVLAELIDAVKCVQCPIRGLFLRHYLLGSVRDKLPLGEADVETVRRVVEGRGKDEDEEKQKGEGDEGKEGEGNGESKSDEKAGKEGGGGIFPFVATTTEEEDPGTIADSISFLLTNFTEMNKLWVRIQHMPSASGAGPRSNDRQAQKEMRKRRERERNELRLLVGTNLVRLSQLDDKSVTAEIYGEIILPAILEQISACRDPLAQAYLMDCIIQVFPDEFHLATLETFLGVCSKLREKVNIRTIVGSIMERLGNYFDDAQLVQDEVEAPLGEEGKSADVVSKVVPPAAALMAGVDAFAMFDTCIQRVYTARGSSMPPKEVIRLQTALLNFTLKLYPDNMGNISECLGVCARYLDGQDIGGSRDKEKSGADAGAVKFDAATSAPRKLDDVAIDELEKLLSIPLDSLALRVLELEHYSDLLTFLPWDNRRQVAVVMLNAVLSSGTALTDLSQIEEMFSIVTPLIQDEHGAMEGPGIDTVNRTADLLGALGVGDAAENASGAGADSNSIAFVEEQVLVGKLVHLLSSEDTDTAYEMLIVARRHLREGGKKRMAYTLTPVVFAAFSLIDMVKTAEFIPEPSADSPPPVPVVEAGDENDDDVSELGDALSKASLKEAPPAFTKAVNCRKLFVFLQETVALLAPSDPELGFKLYLQIASAADRCAQAANESGKTDEGPEYSAIAYEIMAQAFMLYEDEISDSKSQQRSIVSMIGTLLACRTFVKDDYEALVTKTAQYAAKLLKKTDQCKTVMLCSHLFYTGEDGDPSAFRNPSRVLECLQRSLKIADACCMASSANVQLFVDILDQYVYYYENECPVITDKFVSGLVVLIAEHMENIGAATTDSVAVAEARAHFEQTVLYIKQKKHDSDTAERFAPIQL